jgi:organic radical activating enzyme
MTNYQVIKIVKKFLLIVAYHTITTVAGHAKIGVLDHVIANVLMIVMFSAITPVGEHINASSNRCFTQMNEKTSVLLNVTEECNLDCVYCYEHNKSAKTMSVETAKKIICEHLLNSNSLLEVTIEFHGGEPLLEFENIKTICEWTWSHNIKRPFIFFSTTNGTLLNQEKKNWFSSHKDRFVLALSLDGTPWMQNVNRSNSYHLIDTDFFIRNWPKQPAKMTISNHTLSHIAEGVAHLHSLGFRVQNNLAYGLDWSLPENINVLSHEMKKLVEYYLAFPDIETCGLLSSFQIETVLFNNSCIRKWCGCGTHMIAYDYLGIDYPCHMFLPISMDCEQSRLSNRIDFENECNFVDDYCNDCAIRYCCPTCYGINYKMHGATNIRDKNLCALMKIKALGSSYYEFQKIKATYNDDLSDTEKQKIKRKLRAIQLIQESFINIAEGI